MKSSSSSSSSLDSSVVVRRSVRSIKQEARARARALHAAALQLSQSNGFQQVLDMNTHLSVQLPIDDRDGDGDRVPVPVHSRSPQCPSALPSDAVHVDEGDSNKEIGAMEEAKVEEAIEKASVGCARVEMNLNLPPAECDERERVEVEVEVEVEDKENKA